MHAPTQSFPGHLPAQFEKKADQLQLLLYALAVVTTTISVTYSMENAAADLAAIAAAPARLLSEDDSSPLPDLTPQGYSILMLPILTALIATVRSRLRPREKWATCLMAALQIVDQIYKYRLRTLEYDTKKPLPPDKDGNIPNIPQKTRERQKRADFVDMCAMLRPKIESGLRSRASITLLLL